ncbi:hypothetical protein B1C78_04265 [Thioalkalivibrio denitrificans]|uniref:SnoaL-like domain-containing protein n=1 Tax=Thioalkalivibrio denitrificans TaxID=108003 RepID=A0A1V3NQ75_9GAMM|nr:nuclear transport factor 2 family protein [Thioalkalivibrio denitrificans]OOG27200.1 hypothetical protein B1C78_04265 [Thioalkalivibrio denitrificans]
MSSSTQTVLDNHLQATGIGIDAIMEDFGETSVLITEETIYRGPDEIRHFFNTLFESLPDTFIERFTVTRREIVDEVAYIVWEAKPWVERATDTFVVRDGRIRFQTFTAFKP